MLNRREQVLAEIEHRPLRRLSSYDYLIGLDDYSRMGGFRFKENQDGDFINSEENLRIPPLTDVRALIAASEETLSPAYDMNPTMNVYQSLLITNNSNQSDLSILLQAAGDYMLNKVTAEEILKQVLDAVKEWETVATKIGLTKTDMNRFRERFSQNIG